MAAKAFAVVTNALPRETAVSPRSAEWTLYDPEPLASALGLPVAVVDAALERTGFNKAVRIREELIRWKERLRQEERGIEQRLFQINAEKRQLKTRKAAVSEQLQNIRNMLRLPREKQAAA